MVVQFGPKILCWMACCVHFRLGSQAQIVSSQRMPRLVEAAVQDILVQVFEARRTTPSESSQQKNNE